jgi:energy-coupling factor transporter ATP-binding protein EcfA2
MSKAPQEIKLTEQRESQEDYPPVYFTSIELENVLCFKTRQLLDLSDSAGFPAQWTVILGDNGTGKTTLLRCLAAMEPIYHAWEDVEIIALPRLFYSNFRQMDNLLSKNTEISAHFMYGSSLSGRDIYTLHYSPTRPSGFHNASVPNTKGYIFKRDFFSARKATASGGEKELLGFKCYGYGANRKMGKTSLAESLSSERFASLFLDDFTLINAEEWLLQADYSVARSAPDNKPRLERRFYLIQDILKKLLPDVSDIRIAPAIYDNPRPAAEFLTPYGWVPLKSLSLGYKTVIAWIVDLAARLIDRYPNSEDPLAEPAVVLVDEIDLHLHPKWQRTIMSFLTERFPNTQFIVTAHSPLVVQAAKNANIVLLRREGDRVVIDNDPEIIENWRVEQVLSSVFELPSPHSPDIAPLIERRRKLLAKSKLTAKDERELKKLEAQIGTIPTAESPEDIRAMDIIRKAAKLLENS